MVRGGDWFSTGSSSSGGDDDVSGFYNGSNIDEGAMERGMGREADSRGIDNTVS